MTTEQFVTRHGISITCDWTASNPHMDDARDMNHWKTVLRFGRRRMTVVFSMGLGLRGEPTAADVLSSLAMDASSADQDFESWCGDYGYDTDSRKAERTYKAVQAATTKLRRFIGSDDLLRQLIESEH